MQRVELMLLFTACWVLVLVLPHYQAQPTIWEMALSLAVTMVLAYALTRIISYPTFQNLRVKRALYQFIAASYLVPLGILFLGFSGPYYLWSKLGAGSMTLNGQLSPLGDLAQLTSAATCGLPVQIGSVICDPWLRVFNQNPDVVALMSLLKITSLQFFGIATYLLFIIGVYVTSRKGIFPHVPIALFILSPAASLAFERGNEVITVALLLFGIYFLLSRKNLLVYLGILLISLSGFFKLWPTLLILLITLYFRHQLNWLQQLLMLSPVVYWIVNLPSAIKMLNSTQSGSALGNSFGFKLWFRPELSSLQVLFLVLFSVFGFWLAVYFIRFKDFSELANSHPSDIKLLSAYLATYGCLWLIGDSFSYRMLMFIPVLLILLKPHFLEFSTSRVLVVMILLSSFSVRLPVTQAVTTVLALLSIIYAVYLFVCLANRNSQASRSIQ
jgi:hypothetical protein